MTKAPRGQVMASTLVVIVILCLITAMTLRWRLQAARETSGAVDRATQDVSAQSALDQVAAAWALAGASCASAAGVACAGGGCSCACATAAGVTVAAAPYGAGAACQLTVAP
ncbi:MAG: hypothetical protein HKL90_07740 [Elusimicrobia bacterium]|nr:hypothetical protein [Elusimicrobiota bacterium]